MSFISGGTSFGRTSINRGVSLIESMAATGYVDSETTITGEDGVAYKTRRFEQGTSTFTPTGNGQIQYLIVAGGGSGGGGNFSGGGGGGGFRTNVTGQTNPDSQALDALLDVTSGTTYTVVVGDGGAATGDNADGNNGYDSSITGSGITDSGGTNSIVANGGGGGGGYANGIGGMDGEDGGSGGGAERSAGNGQGAGTAMTSPTTQGRNGGGAGSYTNNSSGGGGGGASGVGRTVPSANAHMWAPYGGGGKSSPILTGSNITYAGGGGGANKYLYASNSSTKMGAPGGAGGGGFGGCDGYPSYGSWTKNATAGTDELGGGGGGSADTSGANSRFKGGSGIVIIRWQYE
tara:strand:+ start:458 stop:1501 length:1044 start_codon:yes stop_codon:yes gene_type:complete